MISLFRASALIEVKRTKSWWLLGLLMAVLGLSSAQAAPAPSSPSTDTTATLLWRIMGSGLSGPSYVFGTMHLLCPQDAAVPAGLRAALDSTRQVVLELDMDDPKYANKLYRAMKLPQPLTLRRVMRMRDFRVVKKFFRGRLKQSVLPYVVLMPTLASTVVYASVLPCTPTSYEEQLVVLAKEQQREILGLETIQEQAASMRKQPYRAQAADLLRLVRGYDSIPEQMNELIGLYRRQNVAEIYRYSIDPRNNTLPDDVAELAQRNANWLPKMQTLMAAKPTLFAVGAAHLGGPTGVLEQLRQLGYTVAPVVLRTAPPPAATE